jgi:putative ABC transport system permease protein
MSNPLVLAAWRSHRRQPGLALLAIAGIALGVAVAVAIALANQAARKAFSDSLAGVVGQATHQVVAGTAGIPDAAYAPLRSAVLAAGGFAAPVVEAEVLLPDHPGRVVRLLGVDPFAEAPFRAATGALRGDRAFPLAQLLTQPGAAVMSTATAAALGVTSAELRVRHGTVTSTLHLIATVADDGNALTRANNLVVTDLATAQEVLARVGRLDRVDLILPTDGIVLPLPPGSELVPAARRGESLRQLTEAFHTNLSALGLIALVVGMFLIANTASFAVVRRRELFARLRAHGATPQQILHLALGEAVVAGVIASLLGTALGLVLAQGLIRLVTRTIGDLYAAVGPVRITVEPWILVQGLLLGTVATVIAAAIPAREAARTKPRLGLLRTEPERVAGRALPWLAAAGVGLLGLAAVVLFVLPSTIIAGFVGLGLALVGAALVVPAVLAPLTALLAWPFARRSPLAALAVRAIASNRSRTGIAVAALSVACAAALGMTLMVASFRQALATWLAATITADVYISAPRLVAARVGDAPLDPALIERLLAVPGIHGITRKRDARVALTLPSGERREVDLAAFTPRPGSEASFIARPAWRSDAARSAAWRDFAAGAAYVTEPFATHRQVQAGDTLVLHTPSGDRPVRIAAVLADYSSDQGAVYLHLDTYRAWYGDPAITALALDATPEVGADELVRRLRIAAGDAPAAITPGATLTAASLVVFDRTFAITAVIRWLAAGVAVLGLIAALAAVQVERARTTARLRAIGLTPGGVILLATGESLLTGLAAGILALPIGIGLAAGLTHVINRRSFGWSMDLGIDPRQLLLTIALAAGAAAIAGLIPAIRASRVRVAEFLHEA